MIKSMTGYGRYELVTKERKVVVEIKAVNHRYSDIAVKLPRKLSCFEIPIRNLLKKSIGRGKVDFYLTYEDYSRSDLSLKYNKELASEYFNSLKEIAKEFSISNDINAVYLSRYPEVFTLEENSHSYNHIWLIFKEAILSALEEFLNIRLLEGENLKEDLTCKLDKIESLLIQIEERAPRVLTEYRDKLTNKVTELLDARTIDDNLIIAEVIIFADKICNDEEVVRLKSHIMNMKETLEYGDNIGRKLDFIAQEMNREANTILSKSNDLATSNISIDLKTEIEKVREQIQNIE